MSDVVELKVVCTVERVKSSRESKSFSALKTPLSWNCCQGEADRQAESDGAAEDNAGDISV
jgi:hypothetical protein